MTDRATVRDDLLRVALTEFATAGYGATSLQQIANLAGVSKSTVLYHFESKEHLLSAVVSPALDRLEVLFSGLDGRNFDGAARTQFISDFVDLLLDHRLEVHLFINQGDTLQDVPVIERANRMIGRLVVTFDTVMASDEDRMRFGIALGGTAYMLVSSMKVGRDELADGDRRQTIVRILTELLDPVTLHAR